MLHNPTLTTYRSSKLYYEGDYQGCYRLSKSMLNNSPYHLEVLPVHIASLVMLEKKNEVSVKAHELLHAYPNNAVSFFAGGCYYEMTGKFEMARRFYSKATLQDPQFAPAWIAYGHSFSSQNESDQAMEAYRTASRLFPGTFQPWLFMGMEYLRTNCFKLAEQTLEFGKLLMPNNAHLFNELGIVAYHNQDYERAVKLLHMAVNNTPEKNSIIKVTFHQNLGHAYLKLRQLESAFNNFDQALSGNPYNASATAGVGFTLHLMGDVDQAIKYYHTALTLNRNQEFVSQMLTRAVRELAVPSKG